MAALPVFPLPLLIDAITKQVLNPSRVSTDSFPVFVVVPVFVVIVPVFIVVVPIFVVVVPVFVIPVLVIPVFIAVIAFIAFVT